MTKSGKEAKAKAYTADEDQEGYGQGQGGWQEWSSYSSHTPATYGEYDYSQNAGYDEIGPDYYASIDGNQDPVAQPEYAPWEVGAEPYQQDGTKTKHDSDRSGSKKKTHLGRRGARKTHESLDPEGHDEIPYYGQAEQDALKREPKSRPGPVVWDKQSPTPPPPFIDLGDFITDPQPRRGQVRSEPGYRLEEPVDDHSPIDLRHFKQSLDLGPAEVSGSSRKGGFEKRSRKGKERGGPGAEADSRRFFSHSDVALMGSAVSPVVVNNAPLHWKSHAVLDPPQPDETIEEDTASSGVLEVITDFGQSIYDETKENEETMPSASIVLTHSETSLQDTLTSALVQTTDEKVGFFPWDLLTAIVTESRVHEELLQCLGDSYENEDIHDYARNICSRWRCLRKIFVVLVVLEKTASIVKFLQEGISDSDLPFVKVKQKGNFDLRMTRDQGQPLKCFKRGWSQSQIRNFELWQWATLSPFFGRAVGENVLYYRLPQRTTLPFTEGGFRDGAKLSHGLELEGGSGVLFKASIPSNQHNLYDDDKEKCKSFAIKQLYSSNEKAFRTEKEARQRLSNNHPHMISLLATFNFNQLDSYFFVFPWAEKDLKCYWSEVEFDLNADWDTTRWIAQQCKGIASGLSELHLLSMGRTAEDCGFGYHGDIRPENVLWFPKLNDGILKLSDFGQMTPHISNSPRPYRAPEWDIDDDPKLGRAYDNWALGCVFLEFITWLLGGSDLLAEFGRRRHSVDPKWFNMATGTFFELVRNDYIGEVNANLKPAVSDFIYDELRKHPKCSRFVHDFLDVVHFKMLVFEKNKPDGGRSTSQEIEKELGTLLKRCEDNRDYACRPRGKKNKKIFFGK